MHWWGGSDSLDQIAEFRGRVILSNYDTTYLDVGFGGSIGTGYGHMYTWRDIYENYNPATD